MGVCGSSTKKNNQVQDDAILKKEKILDNSLVDNKLACKDVNDNNKNRSTDKKENDEFHDHEVIKNDFRLKDVQSEIDRQKETHRSTKREEELEYERERKLEKESQRQIEDQIETLKKNGLKREHDMQEEWDNKEKERLEKIDMARREEDTVSIKKNDADDETEKDGTEALVMNIEVEGFSDNGQVTDRNMNADGDCLQDLGDVSDREIEEDKKTEVVVVENEALEIEKEEELMPKEKAGLEELDNEVDGGLAKEDELKTLEEEEAEKKRLEEEEAEKRRLEEEAALALIENNQRPGTSQSIKTQGETIVGVCNDYVNGKFEDICNETIPDKSVKGSEIDL